MSTAGQNFEKYGMYAKSRYPYNQQMQMTYSIRGNAETLGSGVRAPSSNNSFVKDTSFLATDYAMDPNRDLENELSRRRVSSVTVASLVLHIISAILCALLFIAPGWGKGFQDQYNNPFNQGTPATYFGVWLYCTSLGIDTGQQCYGMASTTDMPRWWIVFQILASVAVLLLVLLIILQSVYICRRKSNKNAPLAHWITVFSWICVLVIIAEAVYFGVNFKKNSWWSGWGQPYGYNIIKAQLWWAWYLCLFQILFHGIATFLCLMESIAHCRQRL